MVTTRNAKRNSEEVEEIDTALDSSPVTSNKRMKKLPVRQKDDDEEAAESTPSKAAKGNMVVFGDDDDMNVPAPTITKKIAPVPEEDEEEDDSDEAPEAVSTSQAAKVVKQSTAASQKVAQEKAASQKRKRQERDALLKQQAEERKKHAPEPASKDEAEDEEEDEEEKPSTTLVTKPRGQKTLFPTVLPDEFLTDSDSDVDDASGAAHDRERGPVKRRKVPGIENRLSKRDKGPRDVTVGSTVYRVAKKVDQRLAPKANRQGMGAKEALLRRGRAPVPMRGGGFLKRR
ncbi:hypothetical protein VHEMI05196 [[Torrubiella] hemipterigena]|uniref:U3 snoRNA associated n=1 Tax=[Torrubiella] hemipterigena TaxID=1531966 RepID=A0A0A1TGF8_9HYPO|nr:hypothetical protein VHEMI05196 [[Torrubiella] hemipterigena]